MIWIAAASALRVHAIIISAEILKLKPIAVFVTASPTALARHAAHVQTSLTSHPRLGRKVTLLSVTVGTALPAEREPLRACRPTQSVQPPCLGRRLPHMIALGAALPDFPFLLTTLTGLSTTP